jgi:ribosome-associated protein
MTDSLTETQTETLQQIKAACETLDNKKAENLKILYLGEKSSIADYFVIATGTSAPHLRALGNALDGTLSELGAKTVMDTASNEVGWVVVDAYDCIYHVFTKDAREFYALETLWKDAEVLTMDDLAKL